jgi:hypothetical protein
VLMNFGEGNRKHASIWQRLSTKRMGYRVPPPPHRKDGWMDGWMDGVLGVGV